MKSIKQIKNAFLVLFELLILVSYFTIGLLTAHNPSKTANIVYLIVLSVMQVVLLTVYYKMNNSVCIILHIIFYLIIGIPYSTFLFNMMLNGALTNVIYCGVHNDNGLVCVISFLVLAVIGAFLLIKLMVKRFSNIKTD